MYDSSFRLMSRPWNFTGGFLFVLLTAAAVAVLWGAASASADTGHGIPSAPETLELTPGDGQIHVSWTEPADDGGSDITGYEVQYSEYTVGSTPQWIDAYNDSDFPATQITITGLTNGVEYEVRVRATTVVTTAGVGYWSQFLRTTPALAPAPDPQEEPGNADPSFGSAKIDDQIFTVDEQIKNLQLPPASGGDGQLTYILEKKGGGDLLLPQGLYFDDETRVLSGTPTEPQVATAYIYTVSDYDGDEDELEFTIEIVDPGDDSPQAEDGDGGGCTMIGGTANTTRSAVFSLFLILMTLFSAISHGTGRREKVFPEKT